MPRRKRAPKRVILPDPLFHSVLLAKFINSVMREGKKSLAEKIVYGALDSVVKKAQSSSKPVSIQSHDTKGRDRDRDGDGGEGGSTALKKLPAGDIRDNEQIREFALSAFKKALDNVMPSVEVKSRRVGGSTYQVPVEIRGVRRMALAMRWMVEYANKRNEKTMVMRLASEITDALEGRGGAVKKREDVHRMAKANQAFAHYRW